MFGSDILDVAIGLALVFLLLSLIATAIREGIESVFKTRALYLERGIREMLEGDAHALVGEIYEHPLVAGLYRGSFASRAGFRLGGNLPSYIPARNFALALLDVAVRGPSAARVEGQALAPVTFEGVRAAIARMRNPNVQRPLLVAVDAAGGDLARLQRNVEAWYDSSMDRVSGWYKRRTQSILFVLGGAITLSANINTISIARFLYENRGARDAIVAQAAAVSGDSAVLGANARAARIALDSLQLPIGWGVASARWTSGSESAAGRWNRWVAPLLGWLVTALAVTLGAPFWFDVLNRIMVIRSTVKPHEKSPEEPSEDRRGEPPRPAETWLMSGGRERAGVAAVAVAPGAPATPSPIAALLGAPPVAFREQEWASGDPSEGIL